LKTEITIPEDLLRDIADYARRSNKSRSEIFNEAITEYLARRSPRVITSSMNAVLDTAEEDGLVFSARAAVRRLKAVEW
jgi:metal-responsive CopG/Arc/MetJ family transcriptional regulator